MTKDILINISGLQMDVDPNDPIEMMTTGAYYLRNGKHYILYEELSETTSRKKCHKDRTKECGTYKKRRTVFSYGL